ncbi:hypothetical protein A2U01_0101012, partial [Trifolium medium]|nr:hypothetical protein [Trifolium medium]
TLSLFSPPDASYPSLVDLDNGNPFRVAGPATDRPAAAIRLADSPSAGGTQNGWIS